MISSTAAELCKLMLFNDYCGTCLANPVQVNAKSLTRTGIRMLEIFQIYLQCPAAVHPRGVYEVCLKSNEIVHITILFQTKNQNYNLSPSKYSPWVLTHFAILLCHASKHSWKDFSRMPRSSFVKAFFMSSTPLNLVPLMVLLSFGNKKVTGSQIRGVKRLIHNSNVIFGKEFPDAQSIV